MLDIAGFVFFGCVKDWGQHFFAGTFKGCEGTLGPCVGTLGECAAHPVEIPLQAYYCKHSEHFVDNICKAGFQEECVLYLFTSQLEYISGNLVREP